MPRPGIPGVDRRRPPPLINHGFVKAVGRMQISGAQLVELAERSETCDGRRRHRRRLVSKLNIRVQSRFSQTPRVEVQIWHESRGGILAMRFAHLC